MTEIQCVHEESVLAAARSGEWSDELCVHAAACPVCSEVALVAGALIGEARAAVADEPLPDPGRIWLAARRQAQRARIERATRPIRIVRWAAAACAVATAAFCLSRFGPGFGRMLGALQPPVSAAAPGMVVVQGIVVLIAGGAFVLTSAYALVSAFRSS
jgi:hypothetical protein